MSRAYAFAGKHTKAIETLNDLLSDFPGDEDGFLLRARVYAWDGQYDKSIDDLRFFLSNNPQNTRAWSAIGDVYKWSGKFREAITAYLEWIKNEPEDPEPYIKRSEVFIDYSQARYFNRARNDLRMALDLGGEPKKIDRVIEKLTRIPAPYNWETYASLEMQNFTPERPDWQTYSIGIKYQFKRGSFEAGFQRAARWDMWDSALYGDLYLDLWSKSYGNLRIQTAQPEFLPRMDYLIEIFQTLGVDWELSAGYHLSQYPAEDVNMYLASIAKYFGSFYFRERVILQPISGNINHSHLITARWQPWNIDDYIDLTVGISDTPEFVVAQIADEYFQNTYAGLTLQKFYNTHLGANLLLRYSEEDRGLIQRGFIFKLIGRF